jgi:hypothetical protein
VRAKGATAGHCVRVELGRGMWRTVVLLPIMTFLSACSSSSFEARTCGTTGSVASDAQLTAAQVEMAKAAAVNDPIVKQIAGTATISFGPYGVWIGDCDQVLGAALPVTLSAPAAGTVDHPGHRCVDGITETGIYRTNIDGMDRFSVNVDLRVAVGGAPARVASVDVFVKELGERIAALPYPDEGLPCRTGD